MDKENIKKNKIINKFNNLKKNICEWENKILKKIENTDMKEELIIHINLNSTMTKINNIIEEDIKKDNDQILKEEIIYQKTMEEYGTFFALINELISKDLEFN